MLASEAIAESRLPPCQIKTFVWGKYVGEFKDGALNGQGTFTSPDGGKYVGEWKDGKQNGQGTSTWPDGVEYVSEFRDDMPNRRGTYTWPNGKKFVGDWTGKATKGMGTERSTRLMVR